MCVREGEETYGNFRDHNSEAVEELNPAHSMCSCTVPWGKPVDKMAKSMSNLFHFFSLISFRFIALSLLSLDCSFVIGRMSMMY